jgi:energy-coupling factor transporter ATP-binding protein EcfA2
MVFQVPFGSLDPRFEVGRIVAEPLALLRLGPRDSLERVRQALAEVGLGDEALDRYPHEFSGGQRQRIAIARALITRPKLVVADEPVSALDVSVQAQVLNLMADLKERHGLAYLFISHDLAVVAHLADRIAVMRKGGSSRRARPRNSSGIRGTPIPDPCSRPCCPRSGTRQDPARPRRRRNRARKGDREKDAGGSAPRPHRSFCGDACHEHRSLSPPTECRLRPSLLRLESTGGAREALPPRIFLHLRLPARRRRAGTGRRPRALAA